jgi:hypothetical protein
MHPLIEKEAERLFPPCPTNHKTPYGHSAYTNIGHEEDGLEQCIVCGNVKTTNQPEVDYPQDLV